jgi:hypothetical protein
MPKAHVLAGAVCAGMFCAAALTATAVAQTPEPSLTDLLARAADYELLFEQKFSNMVAEEKYVQQAPERWSGFSVGNSLQTSPMLHRQLRSDFLLVKLAGRESWLPFRDVFEVDGVKVRDREDRLSKLFLQPSATALDQAERVVADSARYNIGPVQRNINMPVLALLTLQRNNQRRFRFTLVKEDPKVGSGIWQIAYREESRPTLIHGVDGADLFAYGHVWIDAATGSVLKTELLVDDVGLRASITTTFRIDATLGVAIPAQMDEVYWRLTGSARILGTATYSNFRRFDVKTETIIKE